MAEMREVLKENLRENKVLFGVIAVLIFALVLQWTSMGKANRRIRSLEKQVSEQSLTREAVPLDRAEERRAPAAGARRAAVPFAADWDPFEEMHRIQTQMDRLFRESFSRMPEPEMFGAMSFEPDADVLEEGNQYRIRLDLPGMEKDKINVEVRQGALVVSGERRVEREDNRQDGFYRFERSFGSFSRAIPLPHDTDPERVSAEYKNGVLEVLIQKSGAGEPKNAKKISVD